MICRKRPNLRRQQCTTPIGQLVGVELRPKSRPEAGREDGPRLLDGECRALDEHVAALGQVPLRHRRDHFVDEQLHVVAPALPILRRHHMRTEEGRHQSCRLRRGQAAVHPEEAKFGVAIKPVAALALDRGDAEFAHGGEPSPRARLEVSLGRRTRLPHGGSDTAAACRDVEVGRALDALLEFVGPPPAEGEMGVTIDESGKNGHAPGVLDREAGERAGCLNGRASPGDAVIIPGQRCIADDVNVSLAAAGAAGGEEPDVDEERQVSIPPG